MSDGQCVMAFTPRKGGTAQVRPEGRGGQSGPCTVREAEGLGQELRSSIRSKRERRKPGFCVLGDGKFSGVMGPFTCIF